MNQKDKPIIYVCSPYAGIEENYKKAKLYAKYVFRHGGIPVVPHTMYHGILDDSNPSDRETGLAAGRALLKLCDAVWVFGKPNALSSGMRLEVSAAAGLGKPVEYIECKSVIPVTDRQEEMSELMRLYERGCGIPNGIIFSDIVMYLDSGMEKALIAAVIETAARKGAKWNYARAILERLLHDGILTAELFKQTSGKPKQKESFGAYDLDLFEKMLNED